MVPVFLSELVRTVVIMTISGGVLALLFTLLKPVVRHRLPKSAQYLFWLVVLVSFLLPVSRIAALPGVIAGIAPIHGVIERNIISVTEHVNSYIAPSSAQPGTAAADAAVNIGERGTLEISPAPLSATFSTLFMIIYPLGVLVVLIYSVIGYARFTKRLRRGCVNPHLFELEALSELSNGKRTPRLIVSGCAATPMLIGVFKPVIVLPNRDYSDDQLYSILLHELTHIRRFDIGVKWLSLLACAVHWFNPLVWITRREIDRACELACDEAVIRSMDSQGKQIYGETLIDMASAKKIPLPVLSTTMCAEKRALKERLTAIMKSKKHTKAAVLFSAAIFLAGALTAFAVGAGGGAAGDYSEAEAPAVRSVQYHAERYMERLVQDLLVGVFEYDNIDNPVEVRPANIIETYVNRLELEAEFDGILPYMIELWRFDFMARTDDFESETLRWGTFSHDADGWVGHHTAWNDARTLLVFAVNNAEPELLGSIPWWMEETPEGLEGALQMFLAERLEGDFE